MQHRDWVVTKMKKYILLFISLFSLTTWSQTSLQESLEYAEAGWNFIYFGEYQEAEKMFSKAIGLNDKNESAQLGYAKVMIQKRNFSKAEETLAQVEDNKNLEKTFLLGLVKYSEGESESSEALFKKVADSESSFASSAKDYLEALKNPPKRFDVGAQVGLVYDSRIIDEDLLSGVDEAGARLFFGANANYRHGKTKLGALSFHGKVANYFSFDDDLSLADPLKIDVSASLAMQKEFFQREFDVVVSPGLELLWLDFDNSGSRDFLYWAPAVSTEFSHNLRKDRRDTYHAALLLYQGEPDSLEDTNSDLDGVNFKGGWKQTRYLNSAKNRLWQSDAYLEANLVSGDSLKFWRLGGSYAYLLPFKNFQVGFVGEGKVSLFPDATNTDGDADRKDIYLGAGALARRSLKEWLGSPNWLKKDWLHAEFRAGFALNSSNLDSRDYERFILSSLLNGRWQF